MNDHSTQASPATDIAAELTQLRTDFGRLTNSVADLVKAQTTAAASSIRASVGDAGDVIAGKAADIGNTALHMTSGAQKTAMTASRDVETSIERNPLTAVLIAAGIGLVLGLASSRG